MAEENTPQPVKRTSRFQRFKEHAKGALKFSFIFFSAIHIAKIVIAAIYYNDCPVEPDIPKFLLALGILGVVTKLVTLFKDFIVKHMRISMILSFLTTAELAILIVASYYVYREYKPDYEYPFNPSYCNKTLYLFAFIYITILYSLLLLVVVSIGVFLLGIVLIDKFGSRAKENPNTPDVEQASKDAKN